MERQEKIAKAKRKKGEYLARREKEQKILKIDEMLQKIPVNEKERIEKDIRIREKKEYIEVKQNLWRKWRGKQPILERKNKIPTDIEKIDKKLAEIEEKIREMQEEEEKDRQRDL